MQISLSLLSSIATANSTKEAQKRTRARLAANVLGLVLVGETVEASGRTLGVSAHVLEVQPVADIDGVASKPLLGDAVDAVTSRAPDGVLDGLGAAGGGVDLFSGSVAGVGEGVEAVVEAVGTAAGAEDLRDRVLVVEHYAAEVAVDAVVEVKHVALDVEDRVLDGATSDHVAGDGESRGSVVTAWLGDDTDRRREVGVDSSGEDGGHVIESLRNEATTNIQSVRVEAESNSLVENVARISDSLEESTRIRSTRTDVEGNTSNVQIKLLGQGEKFRGGVHVSTELLAQTAEALGVIREDAEVELCIREEGLDLVELITVVKSHLLDILLGSVAQVALGLARLSIDNTRRVNTLTQDKLNLRLAGTVEARSKSSQQANDHGIRVALDSKVRDDTAQVFLPAQVLAVDISKVGDEEGVFITSLAVIGVDGLHMLLQRRADHFFGKLNAILSMLFSRFTVEVIGLCRPWRIVRAKVDRDGCHSLGWRDGVRLKVRVV